MPATTNGSCSACRAAYQKVWYAKNKEEHAKRVAKLNAEVRAWQRATILQAKDVPCADCKTRFHYSVMEFDHVRDKKLFNISECSKRWTTKIGLLEEIEKCDVVCANCHRMRTFNRLPVAQKDRVVFS